MTAADRRCDVLIVGGGLVGSALACALSDLPLDTLLVEAHEARQLTQPSFDQRVTALASGSQRILAGLNLWRSLQGQAEAIRFIHISEQGRFGAARIHAEEEGVAALGYTIENQAIGRVLWEALEHKPRFGLLAPAQMRALDTDAAGVVAQIDAGGETANGAREAARGGRWGALVGAARAWRVGARGRLRAGRVILNCRTEAAARGARVRALHAARPRGDPAPDRQSRGRDLDFAGRRRERGDAAAARALPRRATDRVRLQARTHHAVGTRHMHPLARVVSEPLDHARVVLIGNAAMSLHPVAGQGFNLALRDVATLAEVIADELREGAADVGSDSMLARYRQWRSDDQRRVSGFTHGLIRLFGAPAPGSGRGPRPGAHGIRPAARRQGAARASDDGAGRAVAASCARLAPF